MCKLQLGHVFAAVSGVGPREELLGKCTVCAIVLQEPPELSKPDLYFFFFDCAGSCCTGPFSSCGSWGHSLVGAQGPHIAEASVAVETGSRHVGSGRCSTWVPERSAQ